MHHNSDFIYDAVSKLEHHTALPATVKSVSPENEFVLTVNGIQFTVVAKNEIRKANQGLILAQLKEVENHSSRPVIIVAKFIAREIAQELKRKNINYLDIAGNAFIKQENLVVFIAGQKTLKNDKTNQTRAFQETGLKLIFLLLNNPEALQLPYRELAEKAGIAIGSVSIVLKEMEEQNFILKTDAKRILKNRTKLLNRWIVAFNDVLRPKLLKKRLRFVSDTNLNWQTLPVTETDGICIWGGEPAAALMTGRLNPAKYVIYTDTSWQNLIRPLGLRPDDQGEVEILRIFWQEKENFRTQPVAPALLVYADLIGSGLDRNIEIAKIIFKNELSYLQ